MVLLLTACQSSDYREKNITVVVPLPEKFTSAKRPAPKNVSKAPKPAPAADVDDPKPLQAPTEVNLREALQNRFHEIQQMVKSKKLTPDDLAVLVPGLALDALAAEIEKNNLEELGPKLSELRQSLEWIIIDQGFVSEKLSRTRGMVERTQLPEEKAEEYRARLEGISKLIGDENFPEANDQLTSIQEEISPRVQEK